MIISVHHCFPGLNCIFFGGVYGCIHHFKTNPSYHQFGSPGARHSALRGNLGACGRALVRRSVLFSWVTKLSIHVWWCLNMFHDFWSCFMIFDHVWSFLMIFDHVWSYLVLILICSVHGLPGHDGLWRLCLCLCAAIGKTLTMMSIFKRQILGWWPVELDKIRDPLKSYSGVSRRFQGYFIMEHQWVPSSQ